MDTHDTTHLNPSTSNKRVLRSEVKKADVYKATRVGPEYQALIPDFETERHHRDLQVRETLTWAPSEEYSDGELKIYLNAATKINLWTTHKALSLLQFHNGDVHAAVEDLGKVIDIKEPRFEDMEE